MVRPLDPATAIGVTQPIIPLAAIIKLYVVGDPLLAWTGYGDLKFNAGQTGDTELDGSTFKGIGDIIELSTISEGVGGTDSLDVSLPGVDLNNNEMKQVIRDRNLWQFQRALAWLMLIDPVSGAITGKPFRIRTGRIDSMPYSENANGGIIKCKIESQQAYGNEALNSRYSEQIDINSNDTSQKWIWSLANMSAVIGKATAAELNQQIGKNNPGSGAKYSRDGLIGFVAGNIGLV